MIVVSRDGYILWARSSEPALRSRAYFKPSNGPIEIPPASLPLNQQLLSEGAATLDHDANVWFKEPVREMTLMAEQYDFAISLLLLDDAVPRWCQAESEPDAFDQIASQPRRREW